MRTNYKRKAKLKQLALHSERTRAAWETARDEAARLFKIAQAAHDLYVTELSKPLYSSSSPSRQLKKGR